MIIVKETGYNDIRVLDDLRSEPCHAPKLGKGCKSANIAPTCIGRSVRCLPKINRTAVHVP